jgi:hypothetical protein
MNLKHILKPKNLLVAGIAWLLYEEHKKTSAAAAAPAADAPAPAAAAK